MAVAARMRDERIIANINRVVDIATVVLISLAALATAWCSYQASRWSGLQSFDYTTASSARIAASTASARSYDTRLGDVLVFVQYESAIFRHDDAFAAFLYRRFPPDMRSAVDAWLATKPLTNPHAPASPFAMRQYHLKSDSAVQESSRRADSLLREGVVAYRHADDYVLVTVLFASVSFLGGLATKLAFSRNFVVTLIATALLIVATFRMLQLPVH